MLHGICVRRPTAALGRALSPTVATLASLVMTSNSILRPVDTDKAGIAPLSLCNPRLFDPSCTANRDQGALTSDPTFPPREA
jgi:hypothetical protein